MPSELMDQRRLSSLYGPSMSISDEIHMPTQRHMGLFKTDAMTVRPGLEGVTSLLGNNSLASPPLEKSRTINITSSENFPPNQGIYLEKQKAKLSHEYLEEAGRTASFSVSSWDASENDLGSQTNLLIQSASLNVNTNKVLNGVPHENDLASSLPDLVKKKLILSTNGTLSNQSADKVGSFVEDEPFGPMEAKEIEAQTIGNLLPDDEDLLSGVIDELECVTQSSYWNDAEEDLFSCGGGMELEAEERRNYDSNLSNGVILHRNWEPNNSRSGENSHIADPSRTLFVRNVPNNIEDAELRLLFAQYGDIHTMYTACKNRGFVMISYYDLRSACNAMAALQNKLLRNRKLDMHFSITKDNLLERDSNPCALAVFNLDPSISTENVHQIFGAFGEIKQICEHQTYRLIEFYDMRAAETAFHALNMSDVAGKRIKIVASLPGGSRHRSLMQQWPYEVEKMESNGFHPQGSSLTDSASGCTGTVSAGVYMNSIANGTNQGPHSVPQSPISPFMENAFEGYSYGAPHYLSSPARAASVHGHNHNQSAFGEHSHSFGHIGFDSPRNFHPHSLPERHEALINSISYSSPNTLSTMAMNIARHVEGMDNVHAPRVSSSDLSSISYGRNERAFGAMGNGSNTLHGHRQQYSWNNSNSGHQQLQSPVLWQDTAFINSIPTHSPQLQDLSRAHSQMLNAVGALHQHHVGSAPTLNPSIWDRRHMYAGDLSEASAFHSGSIESMGFSASPTLHPMELGSPNIFPHVRGNFVESLIPSPQIGLPSPQQKFHVFHGRNSAISSMPSGFDSPNDRVRNRRSDSNSNQVDNKRQYELDIDRIIRGDDNRTTLMIKNIPNKYTSKMLLAAIDENHRGTYDFIYLPIDFKNKCNVGYAFINMIEAQQIIPFYKTFNGKKWEKFNSEKVASLAYARIQGRAALIAHFQNSSLMNEDKRCRPILFHADGPNAGDQEPFPMGTNIRSRPGRSKAYSSEDNHQGSPSSSTDGEDTSSGVDLPGCRKE